MQQITSCLWFDTQALEAAQFYVSLFKNSKLGEVSYYGEDMPMPKGTVLTVAFELDGRAFTALNGGPVFKLTEAFSLSVACEDQAEIDRFWDALTEGGELSRCGWLKDRYGLSWQVVPRRMAEILGRGGPPAVRAMMGMSKLDIAALEAAGKG